MTDPHAVDPAWVAARNAAVLADPAARVAGNATATTNVEKLTLDRAVVTSIDTSVSDLIPDAAITDQRHSGRCWAFAGLNVLRASLIIADAERPLGDREVTAALREPIGDGGWWPEFARIVAKYGMAPHDAMPDTDSATNSATMNDHLATVLRRAALRLRAAVADGGDPEPIRAAAMEDVHRVLVIHLGTPPSEFVWQYRDKDKAFHRVGTMTPREFAERYATGVEEFVVVAHDPRPEIPLNTRFGIDRTDIMVGEPTQEHVTAELSVLKAAAIAAIRDGEPVWFACDVAKQRDKDAGIWDATLHDYEGLYGVELSMTGVDLLDGAPRRWRVENSWGDKVGEKGFHTMNDSWFDEYVFQVVVRASRLPEEVRAALEADPVILPSWDPML